MIAIPAALVLLAAAVICIRRACRKADAALWEHTTRTDDIDHDDLLDLFDDVDDLLRRAAAGDSWWT